MENLKLYLDMITKRSVKETWVEKNMNDVWLFFINRPGESLSEKVYRYVNDDVNGLCKVCNSTTTFLSYSRGYRTYCSKKCSNSDSELIDKKKDNYINNNIRKYGVSNTSSLESVKSKISNSKKNLDYDVVNTKIKEHFINKYGVDNPSKVDSIKEKKKKTTLMNLGVENPFQSTLVKNKSKETMIEKYGVDHPMKSNDIKNKVLDTNICKYGFDNPMKSDMIKDKFKSTCLTKYGTEHFRNSLVFKNITKKRHINKLNDSSNEKHPIVLSLSDNRYTMKCKDCYEIFDISTNAYNIRKNNEIDICIMCNPVQHNRSIYENDMSNFISSVYDGEVVRGYRDGLEIDIFIPELNIGFEFNGIYWHSELKKENDYHIKKYRHFSDRNIKLIQVWEDDWINNKDKIKSLITNKLGKSKIIYARKTYIKEVSSLDSKKFLNDNHIQGWCVSKIRYGLYIDDELISIMTFGRTRRNLGSKSYDNEYELLRFCNKNNYSVVGGASKLLNFFKKNNIFSTIISYSKNDYSDGDLYNKLGFKFDSITSENYFWLVDGIRENRFNWRKDKLVNMGYDKSLTEVEIMHSLGYWRCFDSGNKKWIYKCL